MNVARLLLSCCVLTFPIASPAALPQASANNGASANSNDAQIREMGRAWLAKVDGVGLSIGIYDAGTRTYYNFGSTQVDGAHPPTKDTVYEIGSISKTFTGQLLARALVEGRANLNDEAERYLGGGYPNLANGGEKVRLVHLANMTSQLLDNIPDTTQVREVPGEPLTVTRMKVFSRYTQTEFLSQLRRVAPQRMPGSDPSHSNVASMVLGVALQKIYGQDFDKILAQEIERPLKMHSGTDPDPKLLARGYTAEGTPLPTFSASITWPSGSLRYSTEDLLRYASWQMVERDASVKLAHQPTWQTLDKTQWIGLYWIGSDTARGRQLRTSGGTWGFASVCELYPEANLAVVLLANKAAEGAQESLRALSARIVDVFRPVTNPTPAGVPPPGR